MGKGQQLHIGDTSEEVEPQALQDGAPTLLKHCGAEHAEGPGGAGAGLLLLGRVQPLLQRMGQQQLAVFFIKLPKHLVPFCWARALLLCTLISMCK